MARFWRTPQTFAGAVAKYEYFDSEAMSRKEAAMGPVVLERVTDECINGLEVLGEGVVYTLRLSESGNWFIGQVRPSEPSEADAESKSGRKALKERHALPRRATIQVLDPVSLREISPDIWHQAGCYAEHLASSTFSAYYSDGEQVERRTEYGKVKAESRFPAGSKYEGRARKLRLVEESSGTVTVLYRTVNRKRRAASSQAAQDELQEWQVESSKKLDGGTDGCKFGSRTTPIVLSTPA